MHTKIKTFEEIRPLLDKAQQNGKKVVLCHGVFDLLHPGHIQHFEEAKRQGELLVVTVTPDQFVNKGPGRPTFPEKLRVESLASMEAIDYVILNDAPDAVTCIEKIRPDVYAKGKEYQDHAKDVTQKIGLEESAVHSLGGSVYYTDGVVFSSSALLNRYHASFSPHQKEFLKEIKHETSTEDLLSLIDSFQDLKVLVVGDAIIDEYQYVEPLGKSAKGLHMTSVCLEKDTFIGGSLIVANHLAALAGQVTLLTALGKSCLHRKLIDSKLKSNVDMQCISSHREETLIKKRYVLKDGNRISKLFETYSSNEQLLSSQAVQEIVAWIKEKAGEYDVVVVADFGNGFSSSEITDALSDVPSFLAINTQMNSGNRGFNVITHYKRADFISLNEPEMRLAAHSQHQPLQEIIPLIAEKMDCSKISVTRGTQGALCYDAKEGISCIPPFAEQVLDRVGAGDSYLSVASLCLAKGASIKVAGFLGSIAAALDVQFIGNEKSIEKVPFCKFLIRLLK